jgi:hypothetical protein
LKYSSEIIDRARRFVIRRGVPKPTTRLGAVG